jgi:hypothetical protein
MRIVKNPSGFAEYRWRAPFGLRKINPGDALVGSAPRDARLVRRSPATPPARRNRIALAGPRWRGLRNSRDNPGRRILTIMGVVPADTIFDMQVSLKDALGRARSAGQQRWRRLAD